MVRAYLTAVRIETTSYLIDKPHPLSQENLGTSLNPDYRLLTRDVELDRMHEATVASDLPRADKVTAAFILWRGLHTPGIDHACHLEDQTTVLTRAWMPPLHQLPRSHTFSVTMLSASASEPMGPLIQAHAAGPSFVRTPREGTLYRTWYVLKLHQVHECLITKQLGW